MAAQDSVIASENTVLRLRLAQLDEALRAIRGSEVDALFVAGAGGGQVYALAGTDRAYCVLIEQMGQGALTLTPDGIVVYANSSFAELLGRPLGTLIGSRIEACFAPEGRVRWRATAIHPESTGATETAVRLYVQNLHLKVLGWLAR